MTRRITSRMLAVVWAFALVVALGLACTASKAFADTGSPTLSFDSATAQAGETVTLDVSISNNPGILGATFEVNYDPRLTLEGIAGGDAFAALDMTQPGSLASGCRVHWDATDISARDVKDGVALTLTFAVPTDAGAGDSYAIGVNAVTTNGVKDVYDCDLNTVDLGAASGVITVAGASSKEKASYVRMLYRVILGNDAPSDYQISYWTNYIETYGAQRAVRALCDSDAFKNAGYDSTTAVRKLYEGILGNTAPTDFQVSYWASRLDNGMAIDQVVDGFSQSAAFGTVCVSYGFGVDGADVAVKGGAADYVRMLYREVLGNDAPSQFQVATWVNNLGNGMRTADVVTQFTQSAAFANAGYTNEQKVRVLYAGMLGNHEPSDFQVSYWAGKLDAGTSLESVIDGFSQSAAFGVVRGLYGLSL